LSDADTAGKLQHLTNAQNAVLRGRIKMAVAVVTVKIMPESPEVNLDEVKEKVQTVIREFTERNDPADQKVEVEPVAFGLKALKIIFTIDEAKGSPDAIEEKIKEIEGVQSFEVVDVRRAIG